MKIVFLGDKQVAYLDVLLCLAHHQRDHRHKALRLLYRQQNIQTGVHGQGVRGVSVFVGSTVLPVLTSCCAGAPPKEPPASGTASPEQVTATFHGVFAESRCIHVPHTLIIVRVMPAACHTSSQVHFWGMQCPSHQQANSSSCLKAESLRAVNTWTGLTRYISVIKACLHRNQSPC